MCSTLRFLYCERHVTLWGVRMRVSVGLISLALMLSFPASDSLAQSPAANLYVVALATVANTAQRPATPLPEGFRDKSVYWRRVKSGDAVSYQLALGFFDTRSDAERAQQQLAASFREARVFSVSLAERENVLKAQQRVAPIAPAPPAGAISPALPIPLQRRRADLNPAETSAPPTPAVSPMSPPPAAASAQTSPRDPLATRSGWEVGGQIADYHYEEPNFMNLTGPRVGVVGAFTFVRWGIFLKADARISEGSLKYQSRGSGTADNIPDSIIETRFVVGGDLLGDGIVLSPYAGLGYRYLYNDLRGYSSTGSVGYRRYSQYLYAPIGLTMRFGLGGQWVLAPTAEYDVFITGSQQTMLSDTGVGCARDVTNTQKSGHGYRAAVVVEKGRWALGPWMHSWNIKDSDVQPIGCGLFGLEPANWTREVGFEFKYRF